MVILFPMSSKQSQQAISAHHLPHGEQGFDAFVACTVHALRLLPEAELTTWRVGTEWPAFSSGGWQCPFRAWQVLSAGQHARA